MQHTPYFGMPRFGSLLFLALLGLCVLFLVMGVAQFNDAPGGMMSQIRELFSDIFADIKKIGGQL